MLAVGSILEVRKHIAIILKFKQTSDARRQIHQQSSKMKSWRTLLNDDPHQTFKELSKSLNVGKSTVSKRLKTAGFVHKQDYRVPRALKDV